MDQWFAFYAPATHPQRRANLHTVRIVGDCDAECVRLEQILQYSHVLLIPTADSALAEMIVGYLVRQIATHQHRTGYLQSMREVITQCKPISRTFRTFSSFIMR